MSGTSETWKCKGVEVDCRGRDVAEVMLMYPRLDGHMSTVEVVLCDVRANSTDVRISYDFDRNGWSIRRTTTAGDTSDPPVWVEAAFISGDEEGAE